ncbi:MAG: hypothetical protein SFV23_01115 [Planctomycetaceae bacterium]|nr:hypothetical protein [Planctomycetaceae bacterium]
MTRMVGPRLGGIKTAIATNNKRAEEDAKIEVDALFLLRRDVGSFQRLDTYLSQIFAYGNTDIDKRSIFFRQVLRLLELGRKREVVDL